MEPAPHPAIRVATEADAPAIRRIKAPYVERTAYNFAYEPPTTGEVAADIRATLARYPFLVAEAAAYDAAAAPRTDPSGSPRLIGFAQAEPYRAREADQWNVELTIYLDEAATGRGIGRALYQELLHLLAAQHARNAYACVTAGNTASLAFHRALGFTEVGRFPKTGYKLGTWHDTVYLWKPLGEVGAAPEPFIPFPQLAKDDLDQGTAWVAPATTRP